MSERKLSGTKEWAETNINIQRGCEHGCRYCYARYNAVQRYKICSAGDWALPVIDPKKVDCEYRKYPGRVMFPSAHDITPKNLPECLCVLRRLLYAGNQVLIVSKPHWDCVTLMCETLEQYRRQITFRFTIGSANDDVLSFWEPNAPNFSERTAALQYAFEKGYSTSVSCEPFLDPWPHDVYTVCANWVTDSFWLGLLNKFDQRVVLDGVMAERIEKYVGPLKKIQSDPKLILAYYVLLGNKPYVKFKDSFRRSLKNTKDKKTPTIAETGGRYRCDKHPARYADGALGKCWECLLGPAQFKKKFRGLAEHWYGPDGPGYAGQFTGELNHGRKKSAGPAG